MKRRRVSLAADMEPPGIGRHCSPIISPSRSRRTTVVMKRTLVVVIGIGVGMTGFVSAQSAAKRPLVIEDYYRVQTVGGMRWSPDGKAITFSVSTRVEE